MTILSWASAVEADERVWGQPDGQLRSTPVKIGDRYPTGDGLYTGAQARIVKVEPHSEAKRLDRAS